MKDEQAQRKEAKRKRRAERAAKPKAGAIERAVPHVERRKARAKRRSEAFYRL